MPRPGQLIALCTLCLLCLGAVMVRSADMRVGEGELVTFESVVFSRSVAHMLVALLAMGLGALIPITRLLDTSRLGPPERRAWRPVLMLGVIALCGVIALVYIPGLGREVNGSHRWISVPVAGSVQPSEFAKWGLLFLLAAYCGWQGAEMRRFTRLLGALAIIAPLACLVIIEDLGTGVLMLAASGLVLLAAGVRIWHGLLFVPPALALLGAALITSPYRVTRLTSFLDPYADPEGSGYHMIQSMVTVAGGEGFGRGLGFGLQKFGYLPEDRTDFLFAVLCEELGVMGAFLAITLYVAILWSGWSILRSMKSATPALAAAKLLGLGVLATLSIQAVINIAVVTGVAPTKGIALPLLSAGGTGWVLTALCLGLLISMDRHVARTEHADDEPAQFANEPLEKPRREPPVIHIAHTRARTRTLS